MKKTQFIIAAPTSNAGKTTLTLGLLRAFKKRGLATQAFKCGPDYIDPKFHEVACHQTGINLDLYMMDQADIKKSYAAALNAADVAVVEGVMGLFDGAKKAERSTAELAKVLELPIVLVVNAKATAYSVAPLLYGFKNFDTSLSIVGVIFNQVNTVSHYSFLKEACEDVGIKALGYLPSLEGCEIPSRHLGLSIEAIHSYDAVIDQIAAALEKTVEVDQLLEICSRAVATYSPVLKQQPKTSFKIAVAKDEAFNFRYPQNIAALEGKGALCYFSPLHDQSLPEADFIYLPGGYPECYLEALSQNHSMLKSLQAYALKGGMLWAECGGMMYLGKAIIDQQGKAYPMVGVFDFITSMEKMKLHLGYRTIHWEDLIFKGHEFHYSTIEQDNRIPTIGQMSNARGATVATSIYCFKRVRASYVHLYWGREDLLEQLFLLINT